MKRERNLYEKIISIDNLNIAELKARKGKTKQSGVIEFDKNRDINLLNLNKILLEENYSTSKYYIFNLYDGKERTIYSLPYYPDRIVHHAIMNILEPIFINTFTNNTYSCIKNRGIHKCLINLNISLKDIKNTKCCLKLDIKKFYPNVNNKILKHLLKRKFKDKKLLKLLFEIIDSCIGLPIGNYLSQFLANFYLTYFDHYIKEVLKVKYYFRYCDDIVILNSGKKELWEIKNKIENYLNINLELEIKDNYQVFPIDDRGIDFLGYVSFHTHILLRKSIKLRFIKMLKNNKNKKSIASYYGWLCWCNSRNLSNKYLKNGKRN